MIDPKAVITAAEAAGKVVPRTVDQIDRLGADVVKLIRLLTAPVQVAAAWQDRLEAHIERAIRKVPEQQRIVPAEAIALPIVEKLRFQTEGDPITELYVNLLARAMDRVRVGEAHPAFYSVITQLAPDELIFLEDLTDHDEAIIMAPSGSKVYPQPSERQARIVELGLSSSAVDKIAEMMFGYEALIQPEMFPVYQEHLQHLGLIEYVNALAPIAEEIQRITVRRGGLWLFSIRLTHFGRLFLKACTQMEDGNGEQAEA